MAATLTQERFPAGIGKKGFWQKSVEKGFPEGANLAPFLELTITSIAVLAGTLAVPALARAQAAPVNPAAAALAAFTQRVNAYAAGFDQGYHFMAIEIAGDEFHFQAISDDGKTVDSGVITRQPRPTM